MKINLTHRGIGYDPSDRTFAAELSSIEETRFSITELCHRRRPLTVFNPRTGVAVEMKWFKTDKDGSDEDTYGWWYRGVHNGIEYKFLFIND